MLCYLVEHAGLHASERANQAWRPRPHLTASFQMGAWSGPPATVLRGGGGFQGRQGPALRGRGALRGQVRLGLIGSPVLAAKGLKPWAISLLEY
jgi:hypothetical protein